MKKKMKMKIYSEYLEYLENNFNKKTLISWQTTNFLDY